jgi:hypothetical protein
LKANIYIGDSRDKECEEPAKGEEGGAYNREERE